MGSRPSTVATRSNGSLTSEAETALRTENTQLKEKLQALEELQPVKIKEENGELRTKNQKLTEELKGLQESLEARKSKEKTKSRRINAELAPHRLSDIDAYGQGIPLEKHPPFKISRSRKKNKKRENNEDAVGDAAKVDTPPDSEPGAGSQGPSTASRGDREEKDATGFRADTTLRDNATLEVDATLQVDETLQIDASQEFDSTSGREQFDSGHQNSGDDGEKKSCEDNDLL